ncbi:MAG: translation initiation factor IF-2 subunit gamma [Candidatus Ranarchaeia archaeon]|jgi:translation initiation factor 2 subunit 3
MPQTSSKKASQSQVNIGVVGHVDHGKTTLVKALSGIWTDRHSEEVRRGISIKLGYADAIFRKCPKCRGTEAFTVAEECTKHKIPTEPLRTVSFVDAPGHEVLLATMLSGAAIMDGAMLVIAANEEVPQPQTTEHLEALLISCVDKVVIVQNKVELVSPEQAKKNYLQIRKFIKGTPVENAPIIPVSAIHSANLDILIETIEKIIPTPNRDVNKDPLLYIARSFDINKPGTRIKNLRGGVIGGSLVEGVLKKGDKIEIRPGLKSKRANVIIYEPVITKIQSLSASLVGNLDQANPGGLIGIGTELDPYLTRGDGLVGNVAGYPAKLPALRELLILEVTMMDRQLIVKSQGRSKARVKTAANFDQNIIKGERIMINIGTAVTVGIVDTAKKNTIEVKLVRPVAGAPGQRVAISRQSESGRFRLVGYGIIKD